MRSASGKMLKHFQGHNRLATEAVVGEVFPALTSSHNTAHAQRERRCGKMLKHFQGHNRLATEAVVGEVSLTTELELDGRVRAKLSVGGLDRRLANDGRQQCVCVDRP
jgi:hypothetical protein